VHRRGSQELVLLLQGFGEGKCHSGIIWLQRMRLFQIRQRSLASEAQQLNLRYPEIARREDFLRYLLFLQHQL
jgi:hypothetical protein